MKKFKSYLIFLWVYSILVVIWGAWVRISKSGDGCGTSWPLCNNAIIPDTSNAQALIEFTHRISTALYGILVLLLVVWTFKIFPKKHSIRRVVLFILSFTILEALIGAQLVLLGLVGDHTGFDRIIVMSLHQVVSILLTGSVARAYYLTNSKVIKTYKLIEVAKFMFLLLVATGGIAALSNTVFPSSSILEGLVSDINPESHILLKLRVIHPILALSTALAFVFVIIKLHKKNKQYSMQLATFFLIGILIGIITLITLSPTVMKFVHLAMAHIIWAVFARAT